MGFAIQEVYKIQRVSHDNDGHDITNIFNPVTGSRNVKAHHTSQSLGRTNGRRQMNVHGRV